LNVAVQNNAQPNEMVLFNTTPLKGRPQRESRKQFCFLKNLLS